MKKSLTLLILLSLLAGPVAAAEAGPPLVLENVGSIRDEHGEAVTVYALQIRDEEDPRPFINDNGFDFVLIPNADAAMAPYGMRATPGLMLVDGVGEVRFSLYDVLLQGPQAHEALGHRAKAARRGPARAAVIRREIDAVLAE